MRVPNEHSQVVEIRGRRVHGAIEAPSAARIRAFRDFLSEDEADERLRRQGNSGTGRGTELFVSSRKSRTQKAQPIKEYADGYGSLTDEQADSLIRRWLDSDIGKRCKRVEYLSRLF
jgi:hypothetical protein